MAARPYGWHRKLLNAQLDPTGGTANHDIAAEPNRSKRPGDHGQCRGPTCAHRSSPDALHQPSVACNSGARTFCSTSKHCNFNDTISMFEMFTRELHATFLRTTTRGRKEPPAEGNSQKPPTSPATATTARSTGALHPIRGTTPDQKRCIAYGSGAAPQHTRINAELANRVTPGPQPDRAQGAEPVMMTPSAQVTARHRGLVGRNIARGALCDDATAFYAAAWTHVDDPVSAADQI